MKLFFEKSSKYILGFCIGMILTILIYQIPCIKFDINGDGKVSLADSVKIVNYYLEQRSENE